MSARSFSFTCLITGLTISVGLSTAAAEPLRLLPLPSSSANENRERKVSKTAPQKESEEDCKREKALPRCVFFLCDYYLDISKRRNATDCATRQLQIPVTCDIRDTPLKEVLEVFRTTGQLTTVIDYAALAEEQIDLDQPLSMQLDEVKFKSALCLLLKKCHLVYQIEGGVVKITTPKQAAGPPVVKFYSVRDLVTNASAEDKNPQPDAKTQLVGLICNTISPRSWACNGGNGSIGFIPLTSCLVVQQPKDEQEQIEELFAALRRNADSQEAPVKQAKAPRALEVSIEAPIPNPIPELPPIDPKIVEALQKVLKEAGEFGVPRLILHVAEQPGSEDQESPETSEWRSKPNEVEFPSLFVDPVDDPLTITEEEEPAEKAEPSPLDLNRLIQEVIDVIHAGQSVLVEKAGIGLELELEVDLQGANVKVLTGYSGHRFVLVSLSPEASGDLRAAQRAHNERILRWIASLNEELFDCDAAEEEDANYGNEPVNEAIP